jgi:hypothetical protein
MYIKLSEEETKNIQKEKIEVCRKQRAQLRDNIKETKKIVYDKLNELQKLLENLADVDLSFETAEIDKFYEIQEKILKLISKLK